MSFLSLNSDYAVMREECPDELGTLSDVNLDALNKTSALSLLSNDLMTALKISTANEDILDNLATKYNSTLSLAKTLKQLEIHFKAKVVAGDSYSAYRMEDYRDRYLDLSRKFSDFEFDNSDIPTIITTSYNITMG